MALFFGGTMKARIRDAAGRFLPGHPVGIDTRWHKQQSGNPAGQPKTRREFEASLYTALLGEGTAQEAAEILWKAARRAEPWAVQLLLQRLSPQATQLKLTHEVDNGGFDFKRLSDAELRDLQAILERATGTAPEPTGGTLPALPEGVHQGSLADSGAVAIDLGMAPGLDIGTS
jgi:hypothetical protein